MDTLAKSSITEYVPLHDMPPVAPIRKADQVAIRDHLQMLFRRADAIVPGSVVAIMNSNAALTELNETRTFPATPVGLDKAAEHASRMNEQGRNVYVGANPRKPGTTGRGTNKDVPFALFQWAEVDDADGEVGLMLWSGATLSATITTGTAPTTRSHVYWELETPEFDLASWKARQRVLAKAIYGDPAVIDESRVLRLAGTWNLPKADKVAKGYRVEQVSPVDQSGTVTTPELLMRGLDIPAPTPSAPEGESKPIGDASSLARDRGELIRVLQAMPNEMAYPDWISMVHAFKAACGDSPEGYEAFEEWSLQWPDNTPEAVQAKWDSVSESRLGADYVYRVASRNGVKVSLAEQDFDPLSVEEGETNANPPIERPKPALRIVRPVNLDGKTIPEQRWIARNWLAEGTAAALYGDGGTGKTLLAQQLMTACATGTSWLGLDVEPCKALGFFCEDDDDELHRRQHAINKHAGVGFSDLGNMAWVSRVGEEGTLIRYSRDGTPSVTPLWKAVQEATMDMGARVVVLDTAADIFGGDENVRGQVRHFMAQLNGFASRIKGVVMLCAHPSRSGMNSGRGDGGSTAWHNGARARLYLARPEADKDSSVDPNVRVLSMPKNNRARTGEAIQLRWDAGALIHEADPLADFPSDPRPAPERAEAAFLAALDSLTAQGRFLSVSANASNYAPRVMAGTPHCAGIKKRGDLKAAMERLFHAEQIEVGVVGKTADRHPRMGLRRADGA